MLVDAGADVDKAQRVGSMWTALSGAVVEGNTDAVRWLLERGADWRKRDSDGKTAFALALASLKKEDVRAYMTSVGLDAWYEYFDKQTKYL